MQKLEGCDDRALTELESGERQAEAESFVADTNKVIDGAG
jgi:hypothetical protein